MSLSVWHTSCYKTGRQRFTFWIYKFSLPVQLLLYEPLEVLDLTDFLFNTSNREDVSNAEIVIDNLIRELYDEVLFNTPEKVNDTIFSIV